jgi:hypothetical protein
MALSTCEDAMPSCPPLPAISISPRNTPRIQAGTVPHPRPGALAQLPVCRLPAPATALVPFQGRVRRAALQTTATSAACCGQYPYASVNAPSAHSRGSVRVSRHSSPCLPHPIRARCRRSMAMLNTTASPHIPHMPSSRASDERRERCATSSTSCYHGYAPRSSSSCVSISRLSSNALVAVVNCW